MLRIILFILLFMPFIVVQAQQQKLQFFYEKNYVKAGDDFQVSIKVSNLPEDVDVTYKTSKTASFDLPVSQGYGIYKFRTAADKIDKTGVRRYPITIVAEFTLNNKKVVLEDSMVCYIGKANVVITPELRGILYQSCSNRMKISMLDVKEEMVNVNLLTNGATVEQISKDSFAIIPVATAVNMKIKNGGNTVDVMDLKTFAIPSPFVDFVLENNSIIIHAEFPYHFSSLCPADAQLKKVSGEVMVYRAGQKIFTEPLAQNNDEPYSLNKVIAASQKGDEIVVKIDQCIRTSYQKKDIVQALPFPQLGRWHLQ